MTQLHAEGYDFAGLIECLRDVFSFVTALQQKRSIASKIQKPRIPSDFSENLVLYLLAKKELSLGVQVTSAKLDRKRADLVALDHSGKEIKIEVKATGKNNFQYFGSKDVQIERNLLT